MMTADTVLIATLGSQPQVITLATQQLLVRAVPLTHVVVLHTLPDYAPMNVALPQLRQAFAQPPEPINLPPLQTITVPISDVITPEQIDRFGDALYDTLRTWVAHKAQVHLLLAGGRKSMAMVGMSIAQMLLGPADCVWYLYSDESLRQSEQFFSTETEAVQLVPIPLPQFAPVPPVYTPLMTAPTPDAAHDVLENIQQERLRHFIEVDLTDAERTVAQFVAQGVLTVAQIAKRLGKKPKTVSNQLNQIYSKLESRFGVQPDKGVKREVLREIMGRVNRASSINPQKM
ncbi:MAG: CRISPR-associated ring nuclease [Chloroflexota bacterium]